LGGSPATKAPMTNRTFTIELPTDGNGLVGGQCTKGDCNKYFKVKPGTGLSKATQAFCPYCGHTDDPSDFVTGEQKEYMLSVVGNQVMAEAAQQLKKHEFNIPARGAFGIGFSLTISHTPEPIRYVVEREIETPLTCDHCRLDYAIYGVFAFCPDCGSHNSLQILRMNIEVISKLIQLGQNADADLAEQLISDALVNAVSAFDGFGREVCRLAAPRSKDPTKATSISFQNIEGARQRVRDLFSIDIASPLTHGEWARVALCFKKRHLIAHKLGIRDEQYVRTSNDPHAVAGRKVRLAKADAEELSRLLERIGDHLMQQLGL
jgi:hypothetical protein